MHYQYNNRGTCSRVVSFDLNGNIVSNVNFIGGCNGNLKAIAALVEGMEADKVISILKGNLCGSKNTSCADQLAIALEKAKAGER
ncbi:MAG: TIGR03905 family TSCPD domain-containing protein [Clostridia bacterium]|nr:TIGR03905 family TSCPD domain-containing protein [Clostridia bacterium]